MYNSKHDDIVILNCTHKISYLRNTIISSLENLNIMQVMRVKLKEFRINQIHQ